MTDQLNSFSSEIARVAREMGSEGRLGGQVQVRGVAGTWKFLIDDVNTMAARFTGQFRAIAEVTTAVALGDLSKMITLNMEGEFLELKGTINCMVNQLSSLTNEFTRVAMDIDTKGKLGGQAMVKGVAGTWKHLTMGMNSVVADLTGQLRAISKVTTAVANGDLSKKITIDARGELLELQDTINTMIDQLNLLTSKLNP